MVYASKKGEFVHQKDSVAVVCWLLLMHSFAITPAGYVHAVTQWSGASTRPQCIEQLVQYTTVQTMTVYFQNQNIHARLVHTTATHKCTTSASFKTSWALTLCGSIGRVALGVQ